MSEAASDMATRKAVFLLTEAWLAIGRARSEGCAPDTLMMSPERAKADGAQEGLVVDGCAVMFGANCGGDVFAFTSASASDSGPRGATMTATPARAGNGVRERNATMTALESLRHAVWRLANGRRGA